MRLPSKDIERESILIVIERKRWGKVSDWKSHSETKRSSENLRFWIMKNYYKYFTDLIEYVFFLAREDWIYFHNYIQRCLRITGYLCGEQIRDLRKLAHYYIAERRRYINVQGTVRFYDERLNHSGRISVFYRSIIKYKGYYGSSGKERCLRAEEIDHDIVYPYFKNDPMLRAIFQHCWTVCPEMADEMSFIGRMKEEK